MSAAQDVLSGQATPEQIEGLFRLTPRARLISAVANTIGEWCFDDDADIRKLRLKERGFNQEEIVELLQIKLKPHSNRPQSRQLAVIHCLVKDNHASKCLSILDHVTSHHHFLSILQTKTGDGLNVLNWAFELNKLAVCPCLMKNLNKDEILILLSIKHGLDADHMTCPHLSVTCNNSLLNFLTIFDDRHQTLKLLSIKNGKGRTILSQAIMARSENSFQSILHHFKDNRLALLKLATITDDYGDTSFHLASYAPSDYFLDLMEATCQTDLHSALCIRNGRGQTVLSLSIYWQDEIAFKCILFYYARYKWTKTVAKHMGNQLKLLELADVIGNDDNTSFHEAANLPSAFFLTALVDATSKEDPHQVFCSRNLLGQTVLLRSIHGKCKNTFQCLLDLYKGKPSKLLELAAIPDYQVNTSFHLAAGCKDQLFMISLIKATRPKDLHFTFCSKNRQGKTVLSYCMKGDRRNENALELILQYYNAGEHRQPILLLELAAIRDNNGNSGYHYAASQRTTKALRSLIKATYCSVETRRQLTDALSTPSETGGITIGNLTWEPHRNNELIYNWALDSLVHNCYLLFDLPTVLVMYTTANRNGAKTEAKNFVEPLESLGLEVTSVEDFTEERLFEEIDRSQNCISGNGRIIALMSHGTNGGIFDNTGKMILLKKIDNRMRDVEPGTPQVLILQCCQIEVETKKASTQTGSAAGSRFRIDAYESISHDMCVLMSGTTGSTSKRNLFMPALGKATAQLKSNQHIEVAMKSAKREVKVKSIYRQQASTQDNMDYYFCIANILPLYIASHKKRGADNS